MHMAKKKKFVVVPSIGADGYDHSAPERGEQAPVQKQESRSVIRVFMLQEAKAKKVDRKKAALLRMMYRD